MRIISLLKIIYLKIPNRIRILLRPFLFLYKGMTSIYPPVYIWNGTSKHNNFPLCVAYIGKTCTFQRYYLSLLFNPDFKVTFLGNRLLYFIMFLLEKKHHDCAITLWELNRPMKWYLQKKQKFIIPFWIESEIDISQPIKKMERKSKSGYRDSARLIRKYGYTCEFSNEPDVFADFYHNMYTPFVRYRFGDSATLWKYHEIFDTESQHELILLKKQSEILGGFLMKYKNNDAKISFLGIKKKYLKNLHEGLLGALYYFTVQTLQNRGCHKVFIGVSHAFINDSVTRYKIHMLAQLTQDIKYKNNKYISMLILRDTVGLRDTLVNNPFIHLAENEQLQGTLWLSDYNKEKTDFLKNYNRMKRFGVKHCEVNCFGKPEQQLKNDIFNTVVTPLAIHNADKYIVNR